MSLLSFMVLFRVERTKIQPIKYKLSSSTCFLSNQNYSLVFKITTELSQFYHAPSKKDRKGEIVQTARTIGSDLQQHRQEWQEVYLGDSTKDSAVPY